MEIRFNPWLPRTVFILTVDLSQQMHIFLKSVCFAYWKHFITAHTWSVLFGEFCFHIFSSLPKVPFNLFSYVIPHLNLSHGISVHKRTHTHLIRNTVEPFFPFHTSNVFSLMIVELPNWFSFLQRIHDLSLFIHSWSKLPRWHDCHSADQKSATNLFFNL